MKNLRLVKNVKGNSCINCEKTNSGAMLFDKKRIRLFFVCKECLLLEYKKIREIIIDNNKRKRHKI